MTPAKYVADVTAAIAVLAASSCGGASQIAATGQTGTNAIAHTSAQQFVPSWSYPASVVPLGTVRAGRQPGDRLVRHATEGRGIYVAEYSATSIFGYQQRNRANHAPVCTAPWSTMDVNGIAVDGAGNLIDPDGYTNNIFIGQGPTMCGAQAATIHDPYGQPVDASSANALTGTIAVANIYDRGSLPGSISLCSVASGCTVNLTSSTMHSVAGVAMDNRGNCWADANDFYNNSTLIYFAGCSGSGQPATGFISLPGAYGGMDIDNSGNLVTVAQNSSATNVYIYSGCKPACTLVSGPLPLAHPAIYGHLNHDNTRFAAGSYLYGQVDVYRYTPKSLTYLYSFNNGLGSQLNTLGVAYNKRSKQ